MKPEDFIQYLQKVNGVIVEGLTHNIKLYDDENPEWYIKGIYFDRETDKVFFKMKEEK